MADPTIHQLFDLTGKVALVTGGARNLGRDMACALAEAGADVAITGRSLEAAQKTAGEIAAEMARPAVPDAGRKIVGFACDVRYEDQVSTLVDAVLAEFGTIDILVNNAGNVVSTPDNKPLEQRPIEEWNFTIGVNLTGAFLCSKHVVAKSMQPAKQGVIINIGSVAGMVGKDHRVYNGTRMGGVTIDYAAAKGGVINMTREMACWLAQYNIRVNCISPGGFWRAQPEQFVQQYNTLVPMGRMGQDGKEMKGAVVFLASEASSYVTGINLPVDGGMTAW
jgi:NAD(P)-dependent dehydrogenase (short-subunit alcohol dehydrogenase family)